MPKKTLADEIADLDLTAPKDYDPEDLTEPINDRALESEDDAQADDDTGRDHYVQVGRSSLRKQQEFILDDPRYAGQRTSRKDIYSSEEEQEDDEDEQPDAFEEIEDVEDESDKEGESEQEEEEEEDQQSGSEAEDSSEQEEDEDDDEAQDNEKNAEIKQELLRIQQEEKDMISRMSASAQSDIEKGQHVRQQITLWENFLESRIRIQKSVELANQLPQHDVWPDFLAQAEGIEPDLDAVKSELRDAIDDLMELRTGFLEENDAVQLGDRDFNTRKRHLDDDDEYIDALWNDISQVNQVFVPFRDSTLEKWSNKVQAASGMRLNKKFKAFDQNVMTQIGNILSDKKSLIKRTQLQRAEYKILGKEEKQEMQASEQDPSSKVDRHLARYDAEIFDDNDFYQQLLRELIEARMVDTDDPIAMGMRWAARKATEVKKKKTRVYDRKASKDRKLRFDVHEKLQNFMVPIPAGTWHEEMSDELFSSLLGHKKASLEESAA